MDVWKKFILDMAERAGKTFVQVFVLQLIASGWFTVDGIIDHSIVTKAAIAAGGAALSVISSLLSKAVGDPDSASVVPAVTDEHV